MCEYLVYVVEYFQMLCLMFCLSSTKVFCFVRVNMSKSVSSFVVFTSRSSGATNNNNKAAPKCKTVGQQWNGDPGWTDVIIQLHVQTL